MDLDPAPRIPCTLRWVLVGCLLAPSAGCAINPVTGRLEVALTSEAREIELGQQAARGVERQVGLLPQSHLTQYVAELGARLAAHSPRRSVPYTFHVLDMPEPNAFALPGGIVYVSRGLLLVTNSEDELAGVVAHEIGHVAARHAVQRMTRAAPLNLVTGIAAGVTGLVSDSLASSVAGAFGLANAAINAPFDRGQESEADAVGQEIAAAAGWDPMAVSTFLEDLGAMMALATDGDDGGFLSTHPSTPQRVADTKTRARQLRRAAHRPIATDHATFLALLDGLLVGPDPAHGVFEGRTFIHPGRAIALQFPQGWQTARSRQAAAAISPPQDGMLILMAVGEGRALEVATAAVGEGEDGRPSIELHATAIGGQPAATCELEVENLRAKLTWIERPDQVYLLLGMAQAPRYGDYLPQFEATARSFGAASAEALASVSVVRIRILRARGGEALSALLARSDSAMDTPLVAIANGLRGNPSLIRGQRIKVPVREPYRR